MIVGGWDRDGGFDRKGVRVDFRGGAIARVCDSGRPERVDIDTVPPEIRAGMEQEGVISQVAAPIVVSGRLWGATSISIGPPDRFPSDSEQRLGKFTGLVAVALSNAEAREQLTASRSRIVQAGDAERRRLERNLHDGAQQRLVALALALRMAQAKLPNDPDGARPSCWTARAKSSHSAWRSSASSPAASTPRSSPTAGSRLRSRRWRRARPCRWR